MLLAEKIVTFCENCRSIISGFHWNYVWNITFWSIFGEKTHKKHDALSWKNRYDLWKLPFYDKGFSLKLCLKSHVLLYFWRKKHTKNTMHVAEKNVTFYENCRSIIRGFHWNHVWNLTFCSIFGEKNTKKKLCS